MGDRRSHIVFALEALDRLPRTRLRVASQIIETEPVGTVPQGPYLNAAAEIVTRLDARSLLDGLLAIEQQRGRDRSSVERWGPRTLDLDLLLFGDQWIEEPGLTVPHPRLHERLFVLTPLAQIAGGTLVPRRGRTVAELLGDQQSKQHFNPIRGEKA